MWAGIDYGSKMAGTTAICFGNNTHQLDIVGTHKKQDADEFILSILKSVKPKFATIDAPLSLPGVYNNSVAHHDYFYRSVDKELKAMSPMFLGGITARAIKLKHESAKVQVPIFETYPSEFVRNFELTAYYTKKDHAGIIPFIDELLKVFPAKINISQLTSWHHVDALIAWMSCYRMAHDEHIVYGDDEGQIFI